MTAFARSGLVRFALLTALTLSAGAGCSLYRIDIQQGNVVTQEMLLKLRPEMTRQQVRYVLGTPLVADPFHPERWDYIYTFVKGGNPRDRRQLTLVFEGDLLRKVLGDVQAAPGLTRSDGAEAKGADSREPAAPKEQ
ncbi:MAG: outer membrane protein assembly factor BamE [Betaproteobacteria bacterium]